MSTAYKRIGHFRSVDEFAAYAKQVGAALPIDPKPLTAAEDSPLARPLKVGPFTVGNRWTIHPMEGWDATSDGKPTEQVIRRWQHFAESGAKIIWGGEAFAVRHDGRANPQQLYYSPENEKPMGDLLASTLRAHRDRFGSNADGDLLVGLQLTHSGRFSRPNRKDRLEPRIAYHHPVLDRKFNIAADDDSVVLTDSDVRRLIDDYITSARMAHRLGFRFVDVKACHGYLGHEFLSAFDRPGEFGGDLHGRTNFLRQIVRGIQATCPGLIIGVRLSLFDMPPFRPDPALTGGGKFGPGIPDEHPATNYPGFGCDRGNPTQPDLTEPVKLLEMMRDELGIAIVNLSCGSPYYNPHIQRPAYFPPSDGYTPPEDPLIGCARQMAMVREVKRRVPGLPVIGSAYTYFQEYLPHIAQAAVRDGWVDSVGIGRLVLSYWDLPADVLEGKEFKGKKICRTFSDCTTAPRNGIISGCYPLDDYYKDAAEHDELKAAKAALKKRLTVVESK